LVCCKPGHQEFGRPVIRLFTAAFLVFLAASTRAGIIAARLWRIAPELGRASLLATAVQPPAIDLPEQRYFVVFL
jgi:hypothetical protein